MRADMAKVIVERPRMGGAYQKGRCEDYRNQGAMEASQDPEHWDEPGNWEKIRPVGRGTERKSLNENLSPLRKFLSSCVGRPWADVYSEIRERLSPSSAVQMHIVQHLKQYVEVNTYVAEDGRIYAMPSRFSFRDSQALDEPTMYRGEFYVHPETHVLCEPPRISRTPPKVAPIKFEINATHQYRLIDKVWYVVTLEVIPAHLGVKPKRGGFYYAPDKKLLGSPTLAEGDLNFEKVGDIFFPKGMRDYLRVREYGFTNVRAVEKREVGKREAKHLKTLLKSWRPKV